jgi:2-oxoglutarate dehydrogenase E1 component
MDGTAPGLAAARAADSFLYAGNAVFVGEMYGRFLADPGAVDASWRAFFAGLGDDERAALAELGGAGWGRVKPRVVGVPDPAAPVAAKPAKGAPAASPEAARQAALDSIRAFMLIRTYRSRGHLIANLDPLGLLERRYHKDLDYKSYGFTEADLDRPIFINSILGFGETATLRQILDRLTHTYCGSIGVEYMYIQEPAQRLWIQERIEKIENRTDFTMLGKRAILERLTAAESFERFLDRKYTGTKRFGLEGGEATIPALEQILKRGGQLGVREIVIGMPHRGRLNVLANMMGKPFRAIFSEFQGNAANPEDVQGSGDVKYHLGTSADRDFDGHPVHMSLTANPSHLEAVNPVVVGKVRAKQMQRGDLEKARREVMGLLLHGDAAFAGQGLVPETLLLSELKGYRTGGTVHFIVNNQIGFTTNPAYSRPGPYCTDVAKVVQAPIFHVNGDDPEAVVHVARVATEFRHEFQKDVVIDMWCYRRHGHNESDEPAFTQPLMYKAIERQKTTRAVYAAKLAAEGLVPPAEADNIVKAFEETLEAHFEAAASYKPNKADWLEGAWAGIEASRGEYVRGETAVPLDALKAIGRRLTSAPEGFNLNRKIARQLEQKRKAIEVGEGIDWATAEALAFGTLLAEGTPVRLSGQDCGRGTFSQRHAVLVDQVDERKHIPLAHVKDGQAQVEIIDSPLSEASVLGFEYGYSLAEPHALVLWEAQFGDFANGAQVIVDQFICAAESKWLRMSGLVMLLPHGYEGQGPEHSSAKLERYLQLCAEDNMQVVNCTTPANFFHVLRRQMRRKVRKPLVVMTPKSLLRHRLAVSRLAEFGPGSSFHRVLFDASPIGADRKIKRVVLCSGKVYYDLAEERDRQKLNDDIVILRLEQLYPFPAQPLADDLGRFPQAEVVWCQEEPKNMGAWSFAAPNIEEVMAKLGMAGRPRYVGRPAAASPATGLASRHAKEQRALIEAALAFPPR